MNPEPDDPPDERPERPERRNVQFGQRIGVDDVSPPEVAHGSRADESDMAPEPNQGERARFVQPLARRPPAEEASEASEFGEPPQGPPVEKDVGLLVDAPSAWEAVDDDAVDDDAGDEGAQDDDSLARRGQAGPPAGPAR